MSLDKIFGIKGKVCIVTGGAGLLAEAHTTAILEGGGIPVLLDINGEMLEERKASFSKLFPGSDIQTLVVDLSDINQIKSSVEIIKAKNGHIDALINNVANNPKVEQQSKNMEFNSFVDFPIEIWEQDVAVGLTGTIAITQEVCRVFEKQSSGVIINISSDYGIISPDQRIYEVEGKQPWEQVKKPVSYSLIKHALIGFTKYLASYYGATGIRVNTLCPASIFNNQNQEFVDKISKLIPLGRMSRVDEYVSTILYMLSDSCSYMTGATVLLDGGRTII